MRRFILRPRRTVTLAITALVAGLLVTACGGGGGGGSAVGSNSPPIPNRAPVAGNDVLSGSGTALTAMNVLANDSDPDNDTLTVAIEEPAVIGTVAVNADRTIGLTALPSDFKGVTRFKYRVTDPDGLFAVASVAVFVGVDPFRVVFVGDATGTGTNEVYLADFVTSPVAVTAATESNLQLTGFAASETGTTIAYRRASTSGPPASDLSFVQTADTSKQVRIALPAGTTLQQAGGKDQYVVSPDGQWIALVAQESAGGQSIYAVNVTSPTSVAKEGPAGSLYATLPRFSQDSKTLYLLSSAHPSGTNKALYAADLASSTATMFSAASAGASDDVTDYAVASDQARILLRAKRAGDDALYYVNPTQLGTEIRISQAALGPVITSSIVTSTISLPPGRGGSLLTRRVAYTLKPSLFSSFVADVSATPDPQAVAPILSAATVIGLRPDDAAVLYGINGQIYEDLIGNPQADLLVGAGVNATYDSTGNIVLLTQSNSIGGGSPYTSLAASVRPFTSAQTLGTPAMAAAYVDASGFDRAVAILGEGAIAGPAPTSVNLMLVNALAPDKLIPLSPALQTPAPSQLTSNPSQVVAR